MSYIGAKPAEQILSSSDIQDGAISTVDLANGCVTAAKIASGQILPASGIVFPATQSASADANTLDDYEEGTWTPTVTTGTVGTQTCNYIKIGRQVTVWGRLFSFSNRSAGSDVTINNLPFTSGSNSSVGAHGNSLAQFISNMNGLTSYVNSSGTSLIFYDVRSSGFRSLAHSDLNSASTEIYFFATYQTAN
jgi:hypothetical protein